MPDQIHEELSSKMIDLIRRENERIASDHGKIDIMSGQFDQKRTEKDIELIDTLLYDPETVNVMDLSSEMREKLKAIQTRSKERMLINMTKTTADSDEMMDVKIQVLLLDRLLTERKGETATSELLDELEENYALLIASCEYYIAHKDPSFEKGKKRKAMVIDVLDAIRYQASCLRVVRESSAAEMLNGKTLGQILHLDEMENQGEINVQGQPLSEQKENVQKIGLAVKRESLADLSKAGKSAAQFLEMKTKPSEKLAKISEKKRASAAGMYIELRDTLRTFIPGSICCMEVMVDGKQVRLLQKSDNSLYIIEHSKQFKLGFTAGMIVDRLDSDIVENEEFYGNVCTSDVIADLKADGDDMGELLRARKLCASYIISKFDIRKNELDNVPTRLLKSIAAEIARGGLDTAAVRGLLEENDNKELINNAENLELVRIQSLKESGDIESTVTIRKKEEPVEGEKWTADEEKVKNLVAELMYQEDTWTHDEMLARAPGDRVRLILKKNIKFIARLFVDTYKNVGGDDGIINKMLDRIPLSLGGKEDERLKDSLKAKIREMKELLDKKLKEDVVENEVRKKLDAKTLNSNNPLDMFKVNAYRTKEWALVFAGINMPSKVEEIMLRFLDEEDSDLFKQCTEMERIFDEAADKLTAKVQGLVTEAATLMFDEDEAPFVLNAQVQKKKSSEAEIKRPVSITYFEKLTDADMPKAEKSKRDFVPDMIQITRRLGTTYTLDTIIEEAQKGKKGLGRFTKLVLNRYFDQVDTMDKRAMLASAIRNAEPINKDLAEKDKEKQFKRIAGNYLGGILKGAGPLLQKMMQGIPVSGAPEEIQRAIKDMKSNLLPIPDEVVKAQLSAMVERSKGRINRMEVVSSLGAASVGQAFLCKMYGPTLPDEGKNVVVKLLRPDVRNRMEREKRIMIACAEETDTTGGMSATYQGKLAKILEELDLTIEAKNIQLGNVYNGITSSVKTVRINDIIEPTSNALVLDIAEGITADRMIEETKRELNEIRALFTSSEEKKDDEKKDDNKLKMNNSNAGKYLDARQKLISLVKTLTKRQQHLVNLAEIWVEEGIFKAGYYHGDLHAGNILIDDNKATVIDFGNAVKLTEIQQYHITRMMAAAGSRNVDMYEEGFHALLENTSDDVYLTKREELRKMFKKILNMGSEQETGQRIMASLIKAQELGLELPSTVFNFSQGQILLQNTIADVNKMIKESIALINELSGIKVEPDDKSDTDPVLNIMSKELELKVTEPKVYRLYRNIFKGVGKEEFIRDLRKSDRTIADNKKADVIAERSAFDQKYLTRMLGFSKFDLNFDIAEIRRSYRALKQEYPILDNSDTANIKRSDFIVSVINHPVFSGTEFGDIIGGDKLSAMINDAVRNYDDGRFENVMEIIGTTLPALAAMERSLQELRQEQDKKSPDPKRIGILENDFYERYCQATASLSKYCELTSFIRKRLNSTETNMAAEVEKSLKPLFEEEKDGLGAELKAAYEEFRIAKKAMEKEEIRKLYQKYELYNEDSLRRKYEIEYNKLSRMSDERNTKDEIEKQNQIISALELVYENKKPELTTEEEWLRKYRAEEKFISIYNRIAGERCEKAMEVFGNELGEMESPDTFVDAMGRVLTANLGKVTKRLGIWYVLKSFWE